MKQAKSLSRHKTAFFLLPFLSVILSCTVAPSQEDVRGVITAYFKGRNYIVHELQLGSISPVPLGQKTYMGTQGHLVGITRITLEAGKDNRVYKEGEQLTFANAWIRIREKADKKGEWIVADISGISVP